MGYLCKRLSPFNVQGSKFKVPDRQMKKDTERFDKLSVNGKVSIT